MNPINPGTQISAPKSTSNSSKWLLPNAAYLIYISPTTPTFGF